MNIEMAPLLYELALARFHESKKQVGKYSHPNGIVFRGYEDFVRLMGIQKVMAQAELDAIDKVMRHHVTTPAAELLIKEASRHGVFPKCVGRVWTDCPGHYALCNDLGSPNYEGPCDKNCDHNIEE